MGKLRYGVLTVITSKSSPTLSHLRINYLFPFLALIWAIGIKVLIVTQIEDNVPRYVKSHLQSVMTGEWWTQHHSCLDSVDKNISLIL